MKVDRKLGIGISATEFEKWTINNFSLKAKVVNSREVREVVEGITCISDKKLSEIC